MACFLSLKNEKMKKLIHVMFIHMNETYSNSKRERHFTRLLHIAAMLDGFRLLLLILQKGEVIL